MKWQIILLSALILVFMSFSTVWANEYSEPSESQISTSSVASITPLMKGSSGGGKSSSSSSSSSSKTKVKTGDGDDDVAEGDDTGTIAGFPWWIIIFGGIALLLIIIVLVWYFFLRK